VPRSGLEEQLSNCMLPSRAFQQVKRRNQNGCMKAAFLARRPYFALEGKGPVSFHPGEAT
jgi:hypothetical protein